MSIDFKSMAEKLHEHLENLTDEEIQKYFPKSTIPKGWVSIEEHLPMMKAMDIMQGYTKYTVKYSNGSYGITNVSDHNTWYYDALQNGITHWWNEHGTKK